MRIVIATALAVLGGVALAVSGARAQEEETVVRDENLKDVRALLDGGDSYAAVERIHGAGELGDVVRTYVEVVQDLYWKAKDVRGSVAVGRAAVLYCLTKSREVSDEELRRRLRVQAQRLSYDLASFAWPGWAEEGIEIGPAELAAGLDFARLDLRLAQEMGYPPEKQANGHWIVGAQLLAAARLADARAEFEACRAKAREAKDAEKEWMAHGYVGITDAVARPDDDAGRAMVAAARDALGELGTEDATFLAQQLEDVLKVFARR